MDWHPKILESRDPTIIALAWGVVATWWFGLILGGVLASAATFGRRPPALGRTIVQATGFVFGVAALSAGVAFGIARGFALEFTHTFGPVYAELSHAQRLAFTQTAVMHETSYDTAAIATLVVAVWILRGRKAR